MVTCEWAVICDYAIVAQDGKVSAVGILDEIGGPAFPLTHAELWLVARLRGTPSATARLLVELVHPNDDTLREVAGPIEIGAAGVHSVAVELPMLQFPEPGRYTVRLSADARAVRTISLRVHHIHPPEASLPAQTAGTIP